MEPMARVILGLVIDLPQASLDHLTIFFGLYAGTLWTETDITMWSYMLITGKDNKFKYYFIDWQHDLPLAWMLIVAT